MQSKGLSRVSSNTTVHINSSALLGCNLYAMGLPWWLSGKEPAWQCRFDPWVGKIPWRRKWLPTPVFLPGKSHGQRGLGGPQSMGSRRVRHDLGTKQSVCHGIYSFEVYTLLVLSIFTELCSSPLQILECSHRAQALPVPSHPW